MTPVRTAARALLGSVFVVQGASAVANPDELATRAKPVTDRVAPLLTRVNPRIPTDARSLVRLNGAIQVAGGLMLMTPLRRLGAVALAASLVPTTLAGHPFWTIDDPAARKANRIHFLKNISLLGGTLLAAVDTEGRPGLRWRAGHLASDTSRAVHRATSNTRSKANIARKSARLGRKSAIFGQHLVD